jgi:hypothetical protein
MKGSSHSKWYWPPSFVGYGIACVIAWAVIWVLVGTLASPATVHTLSWVSLGWVIGWISAAIARVVYPAPRWTLLTRQRHG